MRRTLKSEEERHPHWVKLPKGAISPTGSKGIAKQFDTVYQTRVLWCMPDGQTVRCAEPFTLRVQVGTRVWDIYSKPEPKYTVQG